MGFAEEEERRRREGLITRYAKKVLEYEEEYEEAMAKNPGEIREYSTKVYDSEHRYEDEDEDYEYEDGDEDDEDEYEYEDDESFDNERNPFREAKDTVKKFLYSGLSGEVGLKHIRGDKIGRNKWRTDMGTQLLILEKTDLKTRMRLDEIRGEEVPNEDIKRFYNVPPIERALDNALDRYLKSLFYETHGIKIPHDRLPNYPDRYFPYYAEFIEGDASLGDNKPLPQVLKRRVDAFIEKEVTTNPRKFDGRIKSFKTMNALIRDAIRKREL